MKDVSDCILSPSNKTVLYRFISLENFAFTCNVIIMRPNCKSDSQGSIPGTTLLVECNNWFVLWAAG